MAPGPVRRAASAPKSQALLGHRSHAPLIRRRGAARDDAADSEGVAESTATPRSTEASKEPEMTLHPRLVAPRAPGSTYRRPAVLPLQPGLLHRLARLLRRR
jgi:hypothetical protein